MRKITLLFVVLLTALMANVSAQQLGTPTVGTATAITAVGFTANWTPADANAISFDVKVYDATPTLIKTVNVTGAATATAAINGLLASTAYTFTVTAKGNGTTITDSPESSPASVSTNAFIILATPTVGTATKITLIGFTANWTAVANATSYDVNVYNGATLVTGSPKNVSGATSATLAITGMSSNTTYTYTVTAKGDNITYANSTPSSSSASFNTPVAGSFLLQYAAADVMTLNADLKGGAADIYELTESGGAYTFNTTLSDNNTIIRSATIRAAAGLAAKPILKLISTNTGGTVDMFNTQVANMTINFTGLEFDGRNTATGGGQPIIFYAKSTASLNCNVYFTNCYIHDCLNASGNGVIRLDGITGNTPGTNTSSMFIKNCTFSMFGGRALYLNGSATLPILDGGNCVVENSTFTHCRVVTSRGNILYNTAGSAQWAGNVTFTHCTVDSIAVKSGENCLRQNSLAPGGVFAVQNCIFTKVQGTLGNVAIDYSYIAGITTPPVSGTGSVTITNPIAAVPVYTNAAALNFRLTTPASFICGDGFVAGNTYGMLAVPSVITGGTNPTATGFTANWAAVTNASSYDVRVYDATPAQVGTTTNVPAGNLSQTITGLSSNATYTYTVTAIGDHVTYFDSSASVASVPVSTVVTGLNSNKSGFSIWSNNKEISCTETGLIQVYNVQGAKVLEVLNANKAITSLQSGLYVVRFTGKDGQQNTAKVLIK